MTIYIDARKLKKALSGNPQKLMTLVSLARGEYDELKDPHKLEVLAQASKVWTEIKRSLIISVSNEGEFIIPSSPIIVKKGQNYAVIIAPKKARNTYLSKFYVVVKLGAVYQARHAVREILNDKEEILTKTREALETLIANNDDDGEVFDPLFEDDKTLRASTESAEKARRAIEKVIAELNTKLEMLSKLV